MKAHIYCNKKRIWIFIIFVWPTVCALGLPTVIFNHRKTLARNMTLCLLTFPGNRILYQGLYKYMEFFLFYLIPMILQIVFYTITCRKLFRSTHFHGATQSNGHRPRGQTDNTTKSRKGVIKMLIASVLIYFISYSPHQILLLYNTFATNRFGGKWIYYVFTTAMGYINSASNPILYCIFCQNFRIRFQRILLCKKKLEDNLLSLRVYTRVPVRGMTDV